MRLDQLPAELQIEALSYLDNTDLKAARAVSTKLRDHASPSLFRSIVACARYEALGAFQKISTDSVLQKYVKEIVFDGSIYCAELAESIEQYRTINDKYEDLRALTSFWSMRKRWQRYKELYAEQEDLKASGILLHTIARALEWTSGVSSIVYSPRSHLIPVETQVVRDLVPRHFEAGRGIPIATPRGHAMTHLEHPFRQLIGAIYIAQYTGVRELRVEAFNEGDQGTPFTFGILAFPHSETELEAGLHLFKHLERCDLDIKVWSLQPASAYFGIQRRPVLNVLLAASDELRHLKLRISDWESIGITVDPFVHISTSPSGLNPDRSMFKFVGVQKRWPKLQSLDLDGVNGSEKDFMDLITLHRDTLTSLSVRNCCLLRGIWANIVDEVVYSTKVFTFVLFLVNEAELPESSGLTQASNNFEQWKYVGQLELSKDGERTFVESEPTKQSVYSRNM